MSGRKVLENLCWFQVTAFLEWLASMKGTIFDSWTSLRVTNYIVVCIQGQWSSILPPV